MRQVNTDRFKDTDRSVVLNVVQLCSRPVYIIDFGAPFAIIPIYVLDRSKFLVYAETNAPDRSEASRPVYSLPPFGVLGSEAGCFTGELQHRRESSTGAAAQARKQDRLEQEARAQRARHGAHRMQAAAAASAAATKSCNVKI